MTLFDRATHVARVPSTNRGLYWWVSREEILLLKPAARNSKRFSLHRLNVTTGRETPLDPFNRKHSVRITGNQWHVSTHGVPGFKVAYWTPECELSPDGEWFLWLSDRSTWVAASLDGTIQREWEEEHSIPSSCIWLRDSKKWVQLVNQYKRQRYTLVEAIVRSVVRPSSPKTTVIKVDDGLLLGVTHRNSILIRHSGSRQKASSVALSEFSLSPERPTRRYSIKLPEPGILTSVALSKSGDQLAWILSVGQEAFPGEYLFWVSGLDGENIGELGRISGRLGGSQVSTSQQNYSWPQLLRWLPDGDEISFVFKNNLYRLQVS